MVADKVAIFFLRNMTPAHYSLRYNVMPYVGALTYGEAGRTLEPVPFPEAQRSVS
jgi:signal peptidase complex subunit 3